MNGDSMFRRLIRSRAVFAVAGVLLGIFAGTLGRPASVSAAVQDPQQQIQELFDWYQRARPLLDSYLAMGGGPLLNTFNRFADGIDGHEVRIRCLEQPGQFGCAQPAPATNTDATLNQIGQAINRIDERLVCLEQGKRLGSLGCE